MAEKYVLGVDFGSDSVRCAVVRTSDGASVAESSAAYPRWSRGEFCNPSLCQYRQHPLDYTESLEVVVRKALEQTEAAVRENVVGISFDTTASTPVLVDREGTPLALLPQHAENPDAMFVLWKDHTAIAEAEEINEAARRTGAPYTEWCGGTYSCEWVWAKMLHVLRSSPALAADACSWVEHCDWTGGVLTGNTSPAKIMRNRCVAGHKAMWNSRWGGLPDMKFFTDIDPLYKLFEGNLYSETCLNGAFLGWLTPEWLKRFGLKGRVAVGSGAIDCHMGAIGAGIGPRTMVKVMGTSTCDIVVAEPKGGDVPPVEGICGEVDGSVLEGLTGYEAGQSAFGDIYAWFKNLLAWGRTEDVSDILECLAEAAAVLPERLDAPIFTDWFNGRRTPFADPLLKGAAAGLTISTSAPEIFAALVESSCFGSRAILEHMQSRGVAVERIVAVGGIARKSPYVMQVMADVLGQRVEVSESREACAAGSAICAAAAAGVYGSVAEAQRAMAAAVEAVYEPNPQKTDFYNIRYAEYLKLGKSVAALAD